MYREVTKAAKGGYKDVDVQKGEAVIAFATYGTRDRDGDIANQGMFTKSWQEFKDVRLFKNHDKNQAPGKILKLWDDKEHAYAHVKFGTSTLGQDTLKDIDEGIITDSSYLFVPMPGKYKDLTGGGRSYHEVFHKEVTVLTHWGAHPESKIKAVQKAVDEVTLSSELLKELNSDELTLLRSFIAQYTGSLQTLLNFSQTLPENSDLWIWVNDQISSISNRISDFKYKVRWYGPQQKEASDDILSHIAKMEKAIRKSTASDPHLQEMEAQIKELKALLYSPGSTLSSENTHEQQKGSKDDEALLALQLLNLSNSF